MLILEEGGLVMESYEINKDTVALVPKDNNHTIVYEVDNSFVVDKSPLKIVRQSLTSS